MTRSQARELQRALNRFTERYLVDVAPLRVDGDVGPSTKKRIRLVKFYLGYAKKRRTAAAGHELRSRMWAPRKRQYGADRKSLARGRKRRRAQRKHARAVRRRRRDDGLATFDGKLVAGWIVPELERLRARGWKGTVASGYRTPAYSEHLCYGICGAPSCPGRCAGRSSNHTRKGDGEGAVDLTFYDQAKQIIAAHPEDFRLRNALPNDPVHFSASGR